MIESSLCATSCSTILDLLITSIFSEQTHAGFSGKGLRYKYAAGQCGQNDLFDLDRTRRLNVLVTVYRVKRWLFSGYEGTSLASVVIFRVEALTLPFDSRIRSLPPAKSEDSANTL